MNTADSSSQSAREAATLALLPCAASRREMPPTHVTLAGLNARDAALAQAIHRVAIKRWLTIEHLLNHCLKKPLHKLEPRVQALLVAAAGQMLFMNRLPNYAIVDESVTLARQLLRSRAAAGLVNAVLRKLARLVLNVDHQLAWMEARDRLPMQQGTLLLSQPLLPDPANALAHWTVATSHPLPLLQVWTRQYGRTVTRELALHSLKNAPTILAVDGHVPQDCLPHGQQGFALWQADHQALTAYLASHPQARVQDPTSAAVVPVTSDLHVRTVLDYCAGLGTKTAQLAVVHPQARITATELDAQRYGQLLALPQRYANVQVVEQDDALRQGGYDLLLLDVPCSNTGVLARRPEARYRYGSKAMQALTQIQRQIIDRTLPCVRPGGHVLYATCSIEEQENQQQRDYLLAKSGGRLIREQITLPGGGDATYHDGGYYALVALAP